MIIVPYTNNLDPDETPGNSAAIIVWVDRHNTVLVLSNPNPPPGSKLFDTHITFSPSFSHIEAL